MLQASDGRTVNACVGRVIGCGRQGALEIVCVPGDGAASLSKVPLPVGDKRERNSMCWCR